MDPEKRDKRRCIERENSTISLYCENAALPLKLWNEGNPQHHHQHCWGLQFPFWALLVDYHALIDHM